MRPVFILNMLVLFLACVCITQAQRQEALVSITRENAHQLQRTAMLGRGGVYDFVWSPDGIQLAVIGPNGVWLYDATNWNIPPVLLDDSLVYSWIGVFDSSGQYLMTADEQGWRIWDTTLHQLEASVPLPQTGLITAMSLSPDGQYLITGSFHGSHSGTLMVGIDIWDIATRTHRAFVEVETEGPQIDKFEFSPDGETLLVWRSYGVERFYQFDELLSQDNPEFGSVEDHENRLVNIFYSLNSDLLGLYKLDNVLGDMSQGNTHEVRDLSDETSLISVSRPNWYDITTYDYARNTNILALSGEMGSINLYDLDTGDLVHTLGGLKSTIKLSFDPSGQYLVSYSDGQRLTVWDMTSFTSRTITDLHIQFGSTVRFHPESQLLASGTEIAEGLVQIWDVESEQIVEVIPGAGGWTPSLSFNRDGTLLGLSTGQGCCPRVWNMDTHQADMTFAGHSADHYGFQGVRFVSFAANDTLFLSIGQDETVRLWDVATGETIQTFEYSGFEEPQVAALISHGEMLITTSEPTYDLQVWDVKTGERLESPLNHGAEVFAFSHDGTRFAIKSYEGLTIYDSDTLEQLYAFEVASPVNSTRALAFSPDKTLIAMITNLNDLDIYDLKTGSLLAERHIADWLMYDLDWSADGRRIAITGREGTIFLFGIISG